MSVSPDLLHLWFEMCMDTEVSSELLKKTLVHLAASTSSAPATIAYEIKDDPSRVAQAVEKLEHFNLVGHVDSGVPHADVSLAHSGSVYHLTGKGQRVAELLEFDIDLPST